jgi:hypothetical protein
MAVWVVGTIVVLIASPIPKLPGNVPVSFESAQIPDKQLRRIEFTRRGMGELKTEKGVLLPFSMFDASDGVKLTAISAEFNSSQRAKEIFEDEIAKAMKLIEHGAKKDKGGKVVGDRARVLFKGNSPDASISALVWTQGKYFHEIISTSWTDIQELEKAYSD